MSTEKSTRPWFRFSLLSFLLIVTIVALGAGLWASLGERAALKQQIQDLRNHYEVLTITDPTKIHILRQETGIRGFELFQVYLPEGRDYRLKYDVQNFPRGTNPTAADAFANMPPGRYDVRFALQCGTGNTVHLDSGSVAGYWTLRLSASRPNRMATAGHGLPNGGPNWLKSAVRVDQLRHRLLSDLVPEDRRLIHFSDASPKKGEVMLHDISDEATLYSYEVRNPAELMGALVPDARWEQEVFRIWIEAKPKP